MTRARRTFMATALSVIFGVAVGTFAGQAAGAASGFNSVAATLSGPVAEAPRAERAPSPHDARSAPSGHRGGHKRQGGDGYGQGQTTPPVPGQHSFPPTPPGGEQPTPPGGEQPTPPGGEVSTTAPAGSGVSPGRLPAGQLPVTGLPVLVVVLMGGLLAVAGFALRYAARRSGS
jgi:hypothetical protein